MGIFFFCFHELDHVAKIVVSDLLSLHCYENDFNEYLIELLAVSRLAFLLPIFY